MGQGPIAGPAVEALSVASSKKRLVSVERPPSRRVATSVRTTAVFALAFALIATAAWMPPHHGQHHLPAFSAFVSGTSPASATETSPVASLPRPPRPKFAPSSRLGHRVSLDDSTRTESAVPERRANEALGPSAELRPSDSTLSLLVYASRASRTRGQPTSA